MIKLIIFDLDGVLTSAKETHYNTLNAALREVAGEKYVISQVEHESIYDGMNTWSKLDKLRDIKGLSKDLFFNIWKLKQQYTREAFNLLSTDDRVVQMLSALKKKEYKLACCTNSIRETATIQLTKIGAKPYFDTLSTSDDVPEPKPHSYMYLENMVHHIVNPDETLIIEDSVNGRRGATRSGAHVMAVNSPQDVTLETVTQKINEIDMKDKPYIKWEDKNLNIVIPMAGAGSRFAAAGYTFPKPLIEVCSKPMIQVVVENLWIDANYIFIAQEEHAKKYNLKQTLNLIAPGSKLRTINGITEGAACTVLTVIDDIDNDKPLLLANSDQYVEWCSDEFLYSMVSSNCDGGILTFKNTHPKWSYAKCEGNIVKEVAEKNPISDDATVGIYYWKHGSDFVKYAKQMIEKNIRTNNEFYICPVFNEAIADGKLIRKYEIDKMWGLGTPEDLNHFHEVWGTQKLI